MMENKRRHKRETTLVVLDVYPEEEQFNPQRVAIKDISIGGCAFETVNEKFSEGQKLTLKFRLGKKVWQIIGTVIRNQNYTHGVEFDSPGFLEKLKRKRLIKKMKRRNKKNSES